MKVVRITKSCLMVFIVLILLMWNTGHAHAQKEGPNLQTFLEKNIGFSKRELNAIDTDVVVKQVQTPEKTREIAAIGIVRINVPKDFFITQFRHIESFMKSDKLEQIGTFSNPPKPEDIAAFQLPKSDLEELAKCKIGNCKFKMPAWAFDHLQEIDWSKGDSAARVTDLFRRDIISYVQNYLKNGNSALLVYADRKKPMALAEGFDSLLAQASYVYRYIPELHRYLKEFPRSAPPGVDDFLYWSEQDFGQRPTTTITHATIYDLTEGSNPDAMIALKQLYASHYFHARFALMALADVPAGVKKPGFYLVYLDRLLFDDDLNWASRKLIMKGVQSYITSWLNAIRKRLQDSYKNKG